MAKRNEASKFRSAGKRKSPAAKAAQPHPIPQPVEDLIEEERERLMRAHSVLDCILVAMDGDDSMPTKGPHYPSLIEIARDLVDESIGQLDATNLQSARPGEDESDKLSDLRSGGHMVREAVILPWYGKRTADVSVADASCDDSGASAGKPCAS